MKLDFNILVLICILFSIIGAVLSVNMIKSMLYEAGFLKKNYKNEDIPLSVGICFIPAVTIGLLPLVINKPIQKSCIIYLALIIAMSFVGLIDDVFGNRNDSGFKGHIKALLKGRLTTGGLKLLYGGIIAFCLSLAISTNVYAVVLNTLIIALFTNLLNLFDLRPGRALKVYWIFILILVPFVLKHSHLGAILIPLTITTFIYAKNDLKAECMMGDAGSNVLGSTLGMIIALMLDMKLKLIFFIVILLLNLLSEKISFTKLIEKNKVLNFVDRLGR